MSDYVSRTRNGARRITQQLIITYNTIYALCSNTHVRATRGLSVSILIPQIANLLSYKDDHVCK